MKIYGLNVKAKEPTEKYWLYCKMYRQQQQKHWFDYANHWNQQTNHWIYKKNKHWNQRKHIGFNVKKIGTNEKSPVVMRNI